MSAIAYRDAFKRFATAQRIEHFILILSFTLLGLTGLPQKYPLSPISQAFVGLFGGIDTIRVIHRIAATVFMLEGIYHLVYAGYQIYVRRRQASMIPTLKDGQDAVDAFKYNVGISKKHPKMPRFNFTEKMEYWAMLWGFFVMALTGFMLWNPIATARLVPGEIIPAAKVAHGGEAILAVLAIILWHFYHVHIRRFNKSMFTGYMTREAMEEEHGLELEQIESGQIPPPPPPAEQRRRLTVFAPLAAVVTAVLLFGVYRFVTFEQTAITTILPTAESMDDNFQPWTPTAPAPTPTLAPTADVPTQQPAVQATQPAAGQATQPPAGGPAQPAETWNDTVGAIFETRCAGCHGNLGGFNAETYTDALRGIEPGDPDGSLVVRVQQDQHPGMFEPDELELIVSWIQAGAPE